MAKKECLKCLNEYTINESNFIKSKYGYFSSYCRKCFSNECKLYRKKHNITSYRKTKYVYKIRESDKKYQAKRRMNKLWKSNQIKLYALNNPEKIKAYKIFKNAINSSKIKRLKCRDCDRLDTHGHHPDYSKPLEVIWLCPIHHKLEHINNRSVV